MVSDNPIPQPLLADQARPQAAQPRQLDADALLQASRRVDWRFLLPDPNLRQVAYIGQPRGTLVDSLRLFSAALTLVELASAGLSAQYDVVVASRPSLGELGRSASLLKPGGFLYVEAYGPFSRRWRRSGGLRFAADYVGAVERLGLVEAEAYWHWPNFESCAEIVPLSDRDAIQLAFGRRRSGTGARLKSALGRVLLSSGLFARLVPCFSVVARKPDED